YMLVCMLILFFFSSRRRHTRSKRDWSSDVCSSDLLYIFFLESGKINIQFIAVLLLPDIRLHQIFRSPSIELPFHFPIFSIIKKWEIVKIKEIIKPVISKCSRQ